MRITLLILFLTVNTIASATNYYISLSGNDSNNGTTFSTPWRSIAKINSAFSTFNPGDNILFNRGDTFYGTIIITKSGIAGNPITFGAYGNGPDPVITGFTNITSWADEGNGIYSKIINPESFPNLVTIDGVNTAMGRWPDTGWMYYESSSSKISITDKELSGTPDWDGADIVVCANSWNIVRKPITNHSGSTISFGSSTFWSLTNGYGYFIQNDLRLIDDPYDWYYDSESKKLYMYFGGVNPTTRTVKAVTQDRLVSISGYSNITINNISFEGSNTHTIYVNSGTNITVQNCNIYYNGNYAIYDNLSTHLTVSKCSINQTNGNAIYIEISSDYATITGNTIQNTGLLPGMIKENALNNISCQAITSWSKNTTVQYNQIINTGYSAILYFGNDNLIDRNFINYFALIKDDCGGIYTSTNATTGTSVTNNIILNGGVGYSGGIPPNQTVSASGIYCDANSGGITISGNTISGCVWSGIIIHSSDNNKITNNTLYNNDRTQIFFAYSSGWDYIRGTTLTGNKLIAKKSTNINVVFYFQYWEANSGLFGISNGNYYARPVDDDDVFYFWPAISGDNFKTLSEWQSLSGQDYNSGKSPISPINSSDIKFEYNASETNKIIVLDRPMIDITGAKFQGSITLIPFTSIVLLNDPEPVSPQIPIFLSSIVNDALPSTIDISFNASLTNLVPAASSFEVKVDSVIRSVNSVVVSGTNVMLTLLSPIVYGNFVTVAYHKPSVNPLQTNEGVQVASFSAQTVTNKVSASSPSPAAPVYVSSSVENVTPSKLDLIFNLSLANIIPANSAFTVSVNSNTRSVSSVAVSGTNVTLTLASSVVFGDVITVAYNKPSSNPLQTSEGGQATSFTAKTVTNKLSAPPPAPAIPIYVSSSVENSAPTKIDINFNLTLAAIVPPASAFTVMVNSSSRAVSSVAVLGTKVTLSLSSAIAFGNVITVAYTKPASNPLQTSAGGHVASFTAQPVSNKVATINNNPVLVVNSPKNSYSGFVYELNATGSYDSDKDNLTFSWIIPSTVPVSSTTGPIVKFLGPTVSTPSTIEFILKISDGKTMVSKNIPVEILPYKPELEAAEIIDVEASSYYSQNYPYNIIDGNIGTMWSANGLDQWLVIELKESFNVQHVKLAFQSGQKNVSYFDILGSADKAIWEQILVKSASCGFSGDLQVFDFPPAKAEKEYKFIKMIGLGNSVDAWNYISELKIYGYRQNNPSSFENLPVKLYPNPAHELFNIRIDEPNLSFDFIKIFNLNGKIVYQDILDKSMREFVVPLSIKDGLYLIQMGSDNLTLFAAKLVVSSK